jgi:hypothetical protein
MPERRAAKPLEWLPSARAAYLETLEHIARDDPRAALVQGPQKRLRTARLGEPVACRVLG